MKRGSVDDAEARARMRHQNLIQDYLELQKEFVMKKKKHDMSKQKRSTLMAELWFLRRRHLHLLKIQAARRKMDDYQILQSSKVPDDSQKLQSSTPAQIQGSCRGEYKKSVMGKTYLSMDLHPLLAGVIEEGRALHAHPAPEPSARPKKKPKTCSVDEKGTLKKKVSWQDQEPVKV